MQHVKIWNVECGKTTWTRSVARSHKKEDVTITSDAARGATSNATHDVSSNEKSGVIHDVQVVVMQVVDVLKETTTRKMSDYKRQSHRASCQTAASSRLHCSKTRDETRGTKRANRCAGERHSVVKEVRCAPM